MGRSSSIDNQSSPDSESATDVRLPQDLITEILLYLPVKSLGRFKCVSKPWLSLIESPQFIKSHFFTSSREGQHLNHQLLFFDDDSGMMRCSLSDALHNPSTIVVSDIEYPFPNPQEFVRIVGIVNGLVCLYVDAKDLYICNPVLKQSKLLPSSTSSLSGSKIVVHWFGYDGSNDDYKVAKVSLGVHDEGIYGSEFKVYSLRLDSWRSIEEFECTNDFGDGTYANGKIFFTTRIPEWRIVSLDMASDKFEEVQGPCYETHPIYCRVCSFGAPLYMFCCGFHSADLWVMDENGVENSWSKMFSFPYDACVLDPAVCLESYSLTKVVCILGDDEIVLEDTLGLIVYRTKSKDFRNIQLDSDLYTDFSVYVESLVAL